MKTTAWLAFLSLIGLFAGGCVRMTNPVLTDQQVIVDKALAGTWVEAGDKAESLEVQQPLSDKTYRVRYVDNDNKEVALIGRLGKVEDVEMVEFQADESKGKDNDYEKSLHLPLYVPIVIQQVDADHITATTFDSDWLQKYVADHPGELQLLQRKDDCVVTSSTADFQKFLLKHLKDDGATQQFKWSRVQPFAR